MYKKKKSYLKLKICSYANIVTLTFPPTFADTFSEIQELSNPLEHLIPQ